MRTTFTGVWAASLTPLTDSLEPDIERLVAHLEHLFGEGCAGAVLFGTTGEATSFSVDERHTALERVLAAGIDPDRLIVGVGCAAPPDTVSLTRHATHLGVAGVLMLPPFYYKGLDDDALAGGFEWIFSRVEDLNPSVLLYNIPQVSGVAITPGLAARLLGSHPRLVRGIKDSSGEPASLTAFLEAMPESSVLTGNELLLDAGLAQGAAGAISGPANVNASTVRALFDSGGSDAAALAALHAFRDALAGHQAVPALKAVVAARSGDSAWSRVRPPLAPLDPGRLGPLLDAVTSASASFGV